MADFSINGQKRDPLIQSMKITDRHRDLVTRYYGKLLRLYGMDALMRRLPSLKRIVWTERGYRLVAEHY